MKFFISADLEGAAWVTNPRQCFPELDADGYRLAVQQMAQEVEAVASAIFQQSSDHQVIVNDSHGYMTNLNLSLFSKTIGERIQILSGKPKTCAMSAGLDSNCDAAIYLGYHAKAGTHQGILNHTFHSKLFDVKVNGVSCGEGAINAYQASLTYGVPVILASGDQAFCAEIRQWLPQLETVCTKTSLSFAAALSRPVDEVLKELSDKTKILLNQPKTQWQQNLLKLDAPFVLEVTFINSLCADVACTLPWITRIDGRTITYTAKTFEELYQALQSCYAILSYSSYMD